MNHKNFAMFTGTIFLIIAILHLLRVIYSWNAVIGDFVVPLWLSWVAFIAAGYLSYQGIKLGKK